MSQEVPRGRPLAPAAPSTDPTTASVSPASAELSPGFVVDLDRRLRPGRLHDPTIKAVVFERVHELHHENGLGSRRITKQLAAEGWSVGSSTVTRYLRRPCPVCEVHDD